MNKINELKTKLEKLIQEKQSNEESIKVLQQNDVSVLEKELQDLNNKVKDSEKAKKRKLIPLIGAIVLLIMPIFVAYACLLSTGALNAAFLAVVTSYIFAAYPIKWSFVEYLDDRNLSKKSRLNDLQKQIDEKEEQMELAKQNEKANEEKLVELEGRNSEISIETANCENKISKYEEIKHEMINAIVNNPEFLNNLDALVNNGQGETTEEKEPQKRKK